jgi:ribosome biogenesis GTPase
MTLLKNYGWNNFHEQNHITNRVEGQSVGRVIAIKGMKYLLVTEAGELDAELSGRLMFGSESEELPKVGDWVNYLDYGQTGYIVKVLPRMNALSRRNPGTKTERQILGTNIDYALIVQGLDRDFNIMRLDRYLTQANACDVTPIVILNKADLAEDLNSYREQVSRLKRDCKIVFCSTLTGFGMEELKDTLEACKTYILIGSSGVGKSSLLNILAGGSVQRTGAVSTFNNKGTHTTTTRELFQISKGSLLIDTPGMREFGLTSEDSESSESLFPVIEEFGHSCHYADCKHLHETGCAVLAALQTGQLDPDIYESYVKLMKEQKRFEIKIEDKKRLGKQFGRMTREAKNYRRKYKY